MAAPPLTDQQRADILADIRDTAGTTDGSVRRIAARHGVGMGSVRRIAEEAGLKHAWRDGAYRTEAANTAKAAHLAERRNQLQADLLDDVEELRERLLGDVVHLNVVKRSDAPGMSYEVVEQTVLPAGPEHWRATMGAITTAAGRAIELARAEAENSGTGSASNLLDQFATDLAQARRDRERAVEAEHGAP